MVIKPNGAKVRLCDLEPGTLFLFGEDCLALKTEYISESGRIEAYIVGTGEFFHGGTKTAKEQRAIMVQPLVIEDAEAHGRWVETEHGYVCSMCGCFLGGYYTALQNLEEYETCPICKARMDEGAVT